MGKSASMKAFKQIWNSRKKENNISEVIEKIEVGDTVVKVHLGGKPRIDHEELQEVIMDIGVDNFNKGDTINLFNIADFMYNFNVINKATNEGKIIVSLGVC